MAHCMSVVVTSSSRDIWGSARLSAKKSSCTRNIASETASRIRRSRVSAPAVPVVPGCVRSSMPGARVYRPGRRKVKRGGSGQRCHAPFQAAVAAAQGPDAVRGAAVLGGGPDDEGERREGEDRHGPSGGRIGHRVPGAPPMLLLDNVGAKSGIRRTTPLVYFKDGQNLVIVASKGGNPRHPAWFHNLRVNPETTVQVGTERRAVHARVA